MKILEIIPHNGVGPIKFGMKSNQVKEAIKELCGLNYDHSESNGLDYFFKSALEVSYDKNGKVDFIGAQPYDGCGCEFTLFNINPYEFDSKTLFDLISKKDHSQIHEYAPYEYIFNELILTLWDADEQYDYKNNESQPVYGQIGIGNHKYQESIKSI